ncbi:hypothetical protein A3L08_08280 [Thermococcus pacificus]|uniref:Uncharacterized protein n=2 Tax=Thermococcus pacificus TaxID=71998 RepID=A0A218P971_9EURY|nr:hypothetical protein A3L08_08280 [Thermococcus pacificus]
MVGVERVKVAVPLIALMLILMGLGNVSGAQMSGNVLHVWSYDMKSHYVEIHKGNKQLGNGDVFAVEQTVFVTNYSGSAYVALLEVQGTSNNNNDNTYSIYWYGENEVLLKTPTNSTTIPLDMSKPHRYRIEMTTTSVRFVIDSTTTVEFPANVKKVQRVNSGAWDDNCTYDMYIDDVKEYWNGQLVASEDFEKDEDGDDNNDDYYKDDHTISRNAYEDSGETVTDSTQVPEFPFLKPLFDYLSSVIG